MTEPERIAAGLTEAQRDMIRVGYGSHDTLMSSEIDPLWYTASKTSPERFSISLTPLGLEVRRILMETPDAE